MASQPDSSNADPPLEELPGLGPKSAAQLRAAGINNKADLISLGAVGAYLRLQTSGKPSLNFLYAIAGAIENRNWTEIARQDRTRLLMELEDRHAMMDS